MTKTAVLAALFTLGTIGALAQDSPAVLRNRLMGAMWQEGLSSLVRMGRGQEPYSADRAERSLARVVEIAGQLPPLWPAGSEVQNPTTRYTSSSKVWETKADFDARLARLPAIVAENRDKAKSGPEGALAAFQAVNTYCDSCHDLYRVRIR